MFCVFKPSAQTHTVAPHCDSHCNQLRVLLTLQFFVAAGLTDNDLLRFGVIAVPSRRKILGILQQAWRWKQARRLDPSSSL